MQPFLVFFVNQVRKLLADDPGNSEYADMEKELEEVRVYLNLFVGYSSNIRDCITFICLLMSNLIYVMLKFHT